MSNFLWSKSFCRTMETTRLSSKGQVTLPKATRKQDHWSAGTDFKIEECPDSIVLRPKNRVPTTSHDDVVGCTGYRGPAKTLDEMDEAIARGVSERHARGRY